MLVLLLATSILVAQDKYILKGEAKSTKIKFKLINNLIVFPVEVNGVNLSFLLDTGVSKPIVFNNLEGVDTLTVNDTEKIFLRGLGEGEPIEAIKSSRNLFKVGDAINVNESLYVIFDTSMNFAPRLGIPVHGILGYDLFRDFVVEVNYASKYLKLYDPEYYVPKKCRKCETFNLEFFNKKPYLNADIEVKNDRMPVKLLIDSGGSDALWLFEDTEKAIVPEDGYYFEDFLGSGLSGSIYGKRSKIRKLYLKGFEFDDVNVAYPDSASIHYARKFKARNGSVSSDILRRFNLLFDYGKKTVTLKKNGNYNAPFEYNKSGISLEYGDVRLVRIKDKSRFDNSQSNSRQDVPIIVVTTYKYALKPAFRIVQLRKESPALRAGLQLNDYIMAINGKEAHEFSLQEMLKHFYGKNGKKINLVIDRDGKIMKFSFKLEPLLK